MPSHRWVTALIFLGLVLLTTRLQMTENLPLHAPESTFVDVSQEDNVWTLTPTNSPSPEFPCSKTHKNVVFYNDAQEQPRFVVLGMKLALRMARRANGGSLPRQFPSICRAVPRSYLPPRAMWFRGEKNFNLDFGVDQRQIGVEAMLLVPLDTCVANLWHGTIDFFLPLVHTLCLLNWINCFPPNETSPIQWNLRSRPALFVELPAKRENFWGAASKGCPQLVRPPFGFLHTTSDTPTAWMFTRVSSSMRFTAADGAPFTMLNDHLRTKVHTAVLAKRFAYGLNITCRRHPPMGKPPFFVSESDATNGALGRHFATCAVAQQTLRRLLQPGPSFPSTMNERRKLRVLFIVRTPEKRNGRVIINQEEVSSNIKTHLTNQQAARNMTFDLTVVPFHRLSMKEQQELISACDILIAPRGAATIHAGMLRPGAAFVSLFPYEAQTNVSVTADNFHWWPFPLLRDDVAVRFVPCAPTIDHLFELPKAMEKSQIENCLQRTVNFCDMKCTIPSVIKAVDDAIEFVTQYGAVATHVFPETKCENRDVDDENSGSHCEYVVLYNRSLPTITPAPTLFTLSEDEATGAPSELFGEDRRVDKNKSGDTEP